MKKLTIAYTPFYSLKQRFEYHASSGLGYLEFRDKVKESGVVWFGGENPFELTKPEGGPIEQLKKAVELGLLENDQVVLAEKNLEKFVKGIEFAKDGVLIVQRDSPFYFDLDIEKQLFTYATETMDKKNLYFYPEYNETRYFTEVKGDLMGSALYLTEKDREKLARFLSKRFGRNEAYRDAEVFVFGYGDAGSIALSFESDFYQHWPNESPTIVANFSDSNSLEEAIASLKEMSDKFPIITWQGKETEEFSKERKKRIGETRVTWLNE